VTEKRKQVIRTAIIDELRRREWSKYRLAKELGMHPNEVNRALSDGYDMRVSTAEKMLAVLGLTIKAK
jgi:ribosome-binding protein aMBF1 (putative translation factor)